MSEYDIQTAQDIQEALKNLLGGTIKEMMEAEMSHQKGYEKSERSDSYNARNGHRSQNFQVIAIELDTKKWTMTRDSCHYNFSVGLFLQKFFRTTLSSFSGKYKATWAGLCVVIADRFYPSSKTCIACGHVKKNLRLSERIYHCENCGDEIDRDLQAAINLR